MKFLENKLLKEEWDSWDGIPEERGIPRKGMDSLKSGLFEEDSFLSKQTQTLQSLHKSHAFILTTGNANNVFISSKLISLYASFKKPHSSTKVFDSIVQKDTFLWNSIIKSHFSNGNYLKAFDFYIQMRYNNTPPNQFTIPMIVATCAELLWLERGKYIHGVVSKSGLFADNSAVGSSFIYMYAKCGVMEDASLMFDEIVVRDVVSWTALVTGYVHNGESEKGLECLCEMHRVGGDDEKVNFRTIEGGFQACGNSGALSEGRCLHGLVVKTGLGCSQVVQSSLLSMYSKCGSVEEAYNSFCEVVDKDVFSWTSIIGVCTRFGFMNDCLNLFGDMLVEDVYPDGIVISCILLGFGNFMMVREGKACHGLIVRRNYVLDETVKNALLSMYCKFGTLTPAEKVFECVHERNKESWNTMVFGYGKMGMEEKCIELFREMRNLGIQADSNTLVSVISSCSQLGAISLCLSVHCYIIKSSMYEDVSIANSLIDMYGKGRNLFVAWKMFSRMQRDVVTWNTMMSSFIHSGHYAEAIKLFDEMISENLSPNSATLVIMLSACSHLPSLEKGKMIHQYVEEGGFELNVSLATALVDMYAKCGQLEKSRELFNSMKEKDAISWNVMISGYGMHGDATSAMEIFQQMEQSNVKPNALTFLSLLSACTHAGHVDEGRQLFDRMQYYSVKPNLKHYSCMVDLLGRSGDLQDAEELVQSMPICPDGGVWGTLLSACKIHNEIEMAIRVAKRAIESDPENDGYYIVLSNMYGSMGSWDEAERARKLMKERGVGKRAGWSSVLNIGMEWGGGGS
ncbi:unnamed protein product [Dovyalis caffra]|uniref:Pentatricopeptide repeat-containing protein n=1 Tax=Dovyalis caffra TaxID=77055 RepID=A0AAV1RE85_9ROSI|nr:unnamed protein product [Dovyalis caffra]